jgi:hypothetical protein
VQNPAHTFPSGGTYTVTLGVTDNGGAGGVSTKAVTVAAPPPPQNKAPHADFDAHCADLDCSFTDKSRDDEGTIASWQWSFGDGGTSNEQSPIHSYTQAGKYQVTLTVTDNSGASETKVKDVDAKAPPAAPTSTTILSDDPDPSDFGAPVTIRFSVTSPEGTPSGTVLVTDAKGGSCSADASVGACTLVPGESGKRDITATYQGSPSFKASSDKEDHTVNAPPPAGTVTSITSDAPDPSDPGQTVTVNFTVTSQGGTPTGSVTVTASGGSESCSGNLSSGSGSCNLSLTASGSRTLTATYQGNNQFAGSSSASAPHSVNQPPPPNQAPQAANDQYQGNQDATLTVPAGDGVLSNDTDPDGDALRAQLQSQPANGTVTLRPDGSFDYTPQSGFVGQDSFTYAASDGSLTSSNATVTLTVTQVGP